MSRLYRVGRPEDKKDGSATYVTADGSAVSQLVREKLA